MSLVLKRKHGQRVRITLPDGRFIWLAVDGATVGLVFDAPPGIEILREELVAEADAARRGKELSDDIERRHRAAKQTDIVPVAAIHRELVEAADSEGGEE